VRTVVAVTTTLRAGGVDYLPSTIEQIEAAGGDKLPVTDKLLYSDGPLVYRPKGWTIMESKAAQGSRKAFWEVLQTVYTQNVDLVAFEDDVLACRNAVTAMVDFKVPLDLAFVSFFDNITPAGAPPGMKKYLFGGAQDFWGAQAIKIPQRALKYLLFPTGDVFPKPRDGRHQGRDVAMQLCFRDSPLRRWGTWFPHFVQHIGDTSVVNSTRAVRAALEGKKRDSKNWAGPDFDALGAIHG
jgi:hypothetical protein